MKFTGFCVIYFWPKIAQRKWKPLLFLTIYPQQSFPVFRGPASTHVDTYVYYSTCWYTNNRRLAGRGGLEAVVHVWNNSRNSAPRFSVYNMCGNNKSQSDFFFTVLQYVVVIPKDRKEKKNEMKYKNECPDRRRIIVVVSFNIISRGVFDVRISTTIILRVQMEGST